MEFGTFMEFPPVAAGNEAAASTRRWPRSMPPREYGLDAIWLAELHGAPERSVLASPMMVASAVAARTKRIKIGIAVQALPLSHPLRLAEEAATVDQISHGRLIYGIGRSGVVRTYEDYGISYAESRDVRRDAGSAEAGVDRAALLVRRQILFLRQGRADPEAI